jgi:hypothetical protein
MATQSELCHDGWEHQRAKRNTPDLGTLSSLCTVYMAMPKVSEADKDYTILNRKKEEY